MTGVLRIERGDASDLAAVMPIMGAAFDPAYGEAWSAQQCAGALTIPGATLLIACASEVPIGFALARTIFEETELLLLAVCPNERDRGVGRALLDELRRGINASNGARLFLEVRENNPARAFYAKFGFREVGFRKNYYRGVSGIYTHAVTLVLDLQDHH